MLKSDRHTTNERQAHLAMQEHTCTWSYYQQMLENTWAYNHQMLKVSRHATNERQAHVGM
jgi:hypothetical protein